jgi:hypothetical protein
MKKPSRLAILKAQVENLAAHNQRLIQERNDARRQAKAAAPSDDLHQQAMTALRSDNERLAYSLKRCHTQLEEYRVRDQKVIKLATCARDSALRSDIIEAFGLL